MDDELIEKMARAICIENGLEPDRPHRDQMKIWQWAAPFARAALQAIRDAGYVVVKPSQLSDETLARLALAEYEEKGGKSLDDVKSELGIPTPHPL